MFPFFSTASKVGFERRKNPLETSPVHPEGFRGMVGGGGTRKDHSCVLVTKRGSSLCYVLEEKVTKLFLPCLRIFFSSWHHETHGNRQVIRQSRQLGNKTEFFYFLQRERQKKRGFYIWERASEGLSNLQGLWGSLLLSLTSHWMTSGWMGSLLLQISLVIIWCARHFFKKKIDAANCQGV